MKEADFLENSTLAVAEGMYSLHNVISVAVPVLFGTIFILGLAGNILVILVVCRNKMLNSTNTLILNLASSDLLFIIICVPSTASDYLSVRHWLSGDFWCKVVHYLIHVTAYVSIYTLVLMSVDRFLAVIFPVNSLAIRTMNNTKKALLVTWTFALVLCLPAFFVYGEVSYEYFSEQRAVCKFVKGDGMLLIVQITFFATSYFLPLTLISFLYSKILWRLWRRVTSTRISRETLQGKRKVTKVVTAVITAFALCWMPIQIIQVLKSLKLYTSDIPERIILQIAANCLAYTNSCINPILYAFLSENFRTLFREQLKCMRHKEISRRRDRGYSIPLRNHSKDIPSESILYVRQDCGSSLLESPSVSRMTFC